MKKSGRREKRKCHVAASRVPVRTAFLFALIVMTRQVCMYVNVRWVMELFERELALLVALQGESIWKDLFCGQLEASSLMLI